MTTTHTDYVDRVNRAIDHIMAHLDAPLPLEAVARVACFSPFHFHRIFGALTGEPLAQFIKRVRLDRALFLRAHEPELSLTDIALRCGFAGSSDFSRAFKKRFGVPPSAFDLETWRRSGQQRVVDLLPADAVDRLERQRVADGQDPAAFDVTLRTLPARRVAYLRILDPYMNEAVPRAAEQLVAWAEARGVADGQWLGYMWEDPAVVALESCRYDVGLVVPDDLPVDEGVSVTTFAPITVADVPMAGPIDVEVRILGWLYAAWLPRSGYVPDHQPSFEAWRGRPFAHGFEHFELSVQLPVVPG